MSRPIVPSVSAIIGPAIDAIVAARPASLAHFNDGGRWCDLPAMWRAQVLVNLARMADEVRSASLRFAKGDALRTLCASEFNTTLPAAPQVAVGAVAYFRPTPNVGHAPPFVVKKGTRFSKQAAPDAAPIPIPACAYVSSQTVYVAQDQEEFQVPIVATSAGAQGNVPSFTNYANPTSIQADAPLADPTAGVIGVAAAGGSSGVTDAVLVAAARAYWLGQFGPTQGALIAGLLQQQSVRHFAAFRAGVLPYALYYATDESWAASVQFSNAVAQDIATNWTGFGCRSRFGLILNQQIAVAATIVLKSTDDLNDTDSIDVNVRAAAESYFNDRPDWYRWRASSLQALIGRADPRILHCTGVTVTDAVTGNAVPEPANTFGSAWSATLTHFYLTDQNCTSTYLPPS